MTFGLELALAGALLGPAQQPPKRDEQSVGTLSQVLGGPRDLKAAVYEDIEVMRQLLARRLAGRAMGNVVNGGALTYDRLTEPLANAADAASSVNYEPVTTPDGNTKYELRAYATPWQRGQSALWGVTRDHGLVPAAVEGVYVEGHGVVFTVTLPAVGDPRPTGPKAAPAAVNDWDRIRKELNGEKVDAAPPAAAQPPSVGDVILRVLAENGQHFRHLDPNERLTVAVTFRGHWPAGVRHHTGANDPAGQNVNIIGGTLTLGTGTGTGTFNAANPVTVAQQPANAATSQIPSFPSLSDPNQPRTARDYELLGDLHLRQQRYDQALDALRRAIEQLETGLKHDPAAANREESFKRLAGLYAKLAQALLAAGKVDEARALLDRTRRIHVDPTGTENPSTKTTKPEPARLPARLIISARKSLLDAVGSGKMDFETFRKQASVDYLTFGDDKSKP
jgi:hypothetical protein